MVIRLQEYNGKNIQNNEVTIDYQKKKVEFKPIPKSPNSLEGITNITTCILLQVAKYWIIATFAIGYIKELTDGIQMRYWVIINWLTCTMLVICLPTIITAPLLIKKWREKYFPIYNAGLRIVLNILKGKRAQKRITIEAKRIINRIIIIEFGNIKLKYKAKGDVARQLKRVEIRSKTKIDSGEWIAIFKFKKKPKKGEIEIIYL